MRKTFCDRCGAECGSVTGVALLRVEHRSGTGDFVGEDEYRPADLCESCTAMARNVLGITEAMAKPAGEGSDDMADVCHPVPPPLVRSAHP